jgi:uncharacterized protein with gpF-like domain
MAGTYTRSEPPQQALQFVEGKQLRPAFDWREVWQEEHAVSFTVAKATTSDVLDDIKASLEDALANGQGFRAWAKDLTPALQAKGWWGSKDVTDPTTGETKTVQLGSPRRLQIIFDANMRTARAASEWARIEQTKDLLPILEYELGPSEHHRMAHVALAGTRLPADDPFWDIYFTPNGYGCKCKTRQMGTTEAAKRGGLSQSPPIVMVRWTNTKTGETTQIPKGTDPGWGFNVGKAALALRRDLVGRGK